MIVPTIDLGGLDVSRFLLGGNPFSGYSHQSKARSAEMREWYTQERLVETLFQAGSLGLNALISLGDEPIARALRSYWDQGGAMRWVAQTDSGAATPTAGGQFCLDHGASACFMQGGLADRLIAQQRYDEVHAFVDLVRGAGLPVGMAGHLPQDFIWAEDNLDLDLYMVSYYNPRPRPESPHHDPVANECYAPSDREERAAAIQRLRRPAIHYKILAAGRTPPVEAFAYAARHMRPSDAVCVGIYTKDNPDMLAESVRLLLDSLRAVGQ